MFDNLIRKIKYIFCRHEWTRLQGNPVVSYRQCKKCNTTQVVVKSKTP